MAVVIGDAWIGRDYPVTQVFGANPAVYAPYGFKGHEGVDFALPTGTQVIAVEGGVVLRVGPLAGWDAYGIFVEIWHDQVGGQKFATLYAHLEVAAVKPGDRLIKGQLLGLSDNTGHSTGPHLHFGLCFTDPGGVRMNQTNGYHGWLDADSAAVATWQLTHPAGPSANPPPMPIDPCSAIKAQLASVQANLTAEQALNQRRDAWLQSWPK